MDPNADKVLKNNNAKGKPIIHLTLPKELHQSESSSRTAGPIIKQSQPSQRQKPLQISYQASSSREPLPQVPGQRVCSTSMFDLNDPFFKTSVNLQPYVRSKNHGKTIDELTHEMREMFSNESPEIVVGENVTDIRQLVLNAENVPSDRPHVVKNYTGVQNYVQKQEIIGKPVQLISNYLKISSNSNFEFYEYKVEFSDNVTDSKVKRKLLFVHKKHFGANIYDGKFLLSNVNLKTLVYESYINDSDEPRTIIINLQLISAFNISDSRHMNNLNSMLRTNLGLIKRDNIYGKYHCDVKSQTQYFPQNQLGLWMGYKTTICRVNSGLFLRLNISANVMKTKTAYEFYINCLGQRKRLFNWMETFRQGVIGTIVVTKYNKRTYRVYDVTSEIDVLSTFTTKNGSEISYLEYYYNKYNIVVQGSKQPQLVCLRNTSTRPLSKINPVYLLPEFCSIIGMSDSMKYDILRTENLKKSFNVPKSERRSRRDGPNKIKELFSPYFRTADFLATLHLLVDQKFTSVVGRVLPYETLYHFDNIHTSIEDDWSRRLQNSPMFCCAKIKHWVIITPGDIAGGVRKFMEKVRSAGNAMSFTLPSPDVVELYNSKSKSYLAVIDGLIDRINPSLIVCVIPPSNENLYTLIKRKLCIDRGVPSQIILAKNILQTDNSIFTKIAIQLNCKLGGAPWKVNIPNIMIIGFHVYRDMQSKNLSYAAMVGTLNDHHTQFFNYVAPHSSDRELSEFIAKSITIALFKYRDKNHHFPSNIVIYRDSNIAEEIPYSIYRDEVVVIKAVIESYYFTTNYGLAYIIVKKQKNTQFFVNDLYNCGIRNPVPGTVVDNTVTHFRTNDFFLVSHSSTFGTAYPTHYTVVENTINNCSRERIQQLTYKLTYIYYNATDTIKIPALCQLAYKLARLTANKLKAAPNPNLDELLYFL